MPVRSVYVSEMKRTSIALAVLALVIVAVLVVGSVFHPASSSRLPGHLNGIKLITAAKTYARDLNGQGLPVPAAVSLKELTARGLLTEADVSGFAGMEVTVNPSVEATRPRDVLVRARLPAGDEFVVLADGSVHEVRN